MGACALASRNRRSPGDETHGIRRDNLWSMVRGALSTRERRNAPHSRRRLMVKAPAIQTGGGLPKGSRAHDKSRHDIGDDDVR